MYQSLFVFVWVVASTCTTFAQTKIRFDSTVVRYGFIRQRSEPYREAWFCNPIPPSGNPQQDMANALIIVNAQGSCGCIVPTYPKEPILPGQKACIGIRYDTQRLGIFTKTITVTCNDSINPTHVITVKGEVYDSNTRNSKGVLEIPVREFDAGTIERGKTSPLITALIKNTGSEAIVVEDIWLSQGTILEKPSAILPSETGVIKFVMKNEPNDFYKGSHKERLYIQTNTANLPDGQHIFILVNRL